MQYRNLIWDFDGTLFDTYPFMAKALQAALKWSGFEEPFDEIYALLRCSKGKTMAYYADKHNISSEQLEARYEACYGLVNISHVLPLPYVAALLPQICAAGGKNFIVTHRGQSVMQYLDHCHLTPYFTEVVSRTNHFSRKPSPEGNLYLIEKYALNPEETLAIGDRELDIEAAKGANIAACLLSKDEVQTAADYCIPDFGRFDRLIGLQGRFLP